jgi:hypothetical protein
MNALPCCLSIAASPLERQPPLPPPPHQQQQQQQQQQQMAAPAPRDARRHRPDKKPTPQIRYTLSPPPWEVSKLDLIPQP